MKTKSYFALCSFLIALLFASCGFGFDTRPEGVDAEFVPVEDITGVPASGQPYVEIPLTSTVLPANAANKTIGWSIAADGGTNSAVEGARLTARNEGTVTVTAVISNGLGEGADFTKNFDILISLTGVYAVQEIYGIPEALPIGDYTYTLNARITPNNASNKNIVWSVTDDGGTGTTINGNYLAAQRKGTVKIRAAIANGRLTSDYTQEFSILISRGVVAAGEGGYWVDGEFVDLGAAISGAVIRGIVYVGNKQFISGHYNNVACYWVDGERVQLNPSTSTSIAMAGGGGYVYILYRETLDTFNYIHRYSKIDASSGGIVHTAVLSNFTGDTDGSNIIAVKNDGSAVIVFGRNYWLSDDGQTTISPVTINTLPGFISCAGLVGGEVYFAGIYGNYNGDPFYYRLSDNSLHVSTAAINMVSVNSILDQNGVPVFYGLHDTYSWGIGERERSYSWGTGWDFKNLSITAAPFTENLKTEVIAFSDGDVYVKESFETYMILKEPYPSRKVERPDPNATAAVIGGIVVIEDSMLGGKTLLAGNVGGITAPSWSEGAAVSLAAPSVALDQQTITAQGWRISADGNTNWVEFSASTAEMSHNGKYIRYYAKGSGGRTYYSNTVSITVR